MFSGLQNIVPSHLMDSKQHDFKNIRTTGVAEADGDKAFDEEAFKDGTGSTTARLQPGLSVMAFTRPAQG